jgi:hypothetical protein
MPLLKLSENHSLLLCITSVTPALSQQTYERNELHLTDGTLGSRNFQTPCRRATDECESVEM